MKPSEFYAGLNGSCDHMREAHREGLKYGLRHIAFNPDDAMADEQLSAFARPLCDELHADPEHLTLVDVPPFLYPLKRRVPVFYGLGLVG